MCAGAYAQTDTIRYVHPDGVYSNDGRSWATATNKLQDAINDMHEYMQRNPSVKRGYIYAIINDAPLPDLKIIYEPSTQILAELYQKMVAACNELEIKITNVQEFIDRYYVLYCLKTDATFAYIQFYWGENKTLSTAMPKSELGDQDMKLKKLIESMQ